MSTFDLNRYEADTPVTPPSVPAAVAEQPITQNTDSTATNDSTVTITGPLSNVYTQALMLVYGAGNAVTTECNQVELATILAIKNTPDAPKESSTLFVSDQDNIDKDPSGTFDQLHLALDNKKNPNGAKHVVLENIRNVNGKTAIILDYARANATKVFYNRKSYLNYIQR